MDRREVLKASAGAAISLVGLGGCRPQSKTFSDGGSKHHRQKVKVIDKGSLSVTDNGKLAGLTLQQLHKQYRYDLFDDFLPFMEKFVIDHELGGFMCNTDRDGTNITTTKNSWYIGRGIWVYSFLYNELSPKKKYLEVARKSVEFVLRDPPKGDELWPAEYTKEGKPVPAKGQYIGGKYIPVSKQIYGDLFIANGLVEYTRTTGDDAYWNMARDIMFKCIRIYDRSDYSPTAPKVYIGPGMLRICPECDCSVSGWCCCDSLLKCSTKRPIPKSRR